MLGYVIIIAELAILYTVFWYVFLRETKPYRVVGDPWGSYRSENEASPEYDPSIRQEGGFQWSSIDEGRRSEFFDGKTPVRVGNFRQHQFSQDQMQSELPTINRNPAVSYDWFVEESRQNASPPAVKAFFRKLARLCERLS